MDGYKVETDGGTNASMKALETSTEARITVRSIAGEVIVQMAELPETYTQLQSVIAEATGVSPGLQKLIVGDMVFGDEDAISDLPSDVTLVVDESPMFTWDIEGNPNSDLLEGRGPEVRFINEAKDYVNVVTREPVVQGKHYFQFVMHKIGDEQWCGVAADGQRRAGSRGDESGYFYYCGRRGASKGALHAPKERAKCMDFDHVKDGDVIGIFLDMSSQSIGFDLNGKFQGVTKAPSSPLYLTTSLDKEDDYVVLRKLPLADVMHDLLEQFENNSTVVIDDDTCSMSDSD
jgi:hypothetical protein